MNGGHVHLMRCTQIMRYEVEQFDLIVPALVRSSGLQSTKVGLYRWNELKQTCSLESRRYGEMTGNPHYRIKTENPGHKTCLSPSTPPPLTHEILVHPSQCRSRRIPVRPKGD